MFNLFKKGSRKTDEDEGKTWDPDKVTVFYQGEVMSPEYAAETLLYPNNGRKIREDFNNQPYPYHCLFPHGQGKITYKDEHGDIMEEYEGEFEAGQYHGSGTLVDRYGEIMEGQFSENLFKG